MSFRPASRWGPLEAYPHQVAFAIQVGRNFILQGLGMAMVALMALGTLPWPAVLAWTLAVCAVAIAEQKVLRTVADPVGAPGPTSLWAPALRFASTTLYAAAALALIVTGDVGERLFAFALMGASTINVLMRYYRSPQILIASLSPYIAIMTGANRST